MMGYLFGSVSIPVRSSVLVSHQLSAVAHKFVRECPSARFLRTLTCNSTSVMAVGHVGPRLRPCVMKKN